MKRSTTLLSALALVLGGAAASPAHAAPPADPLDVYVAQVTPEQAGDLSRQGFDVAGTRRSGDKVEVDLVLDTAQQQELAKRGVTAQLKKNKDGKSTRQLAAEQAVNGFTVWRSYDEPGGIRDQLYALARTNQNLVKLEVLGKTGQGREIIAVKVTQGANGLRDGARPAVLYSSTQHAREWISTEVNRRLLNHYVNRFKAGDTEIKNLLKDTELWFVLVANPDGYQYTFDVERLWRKNLRDNDGNGQITVGDGVDPNRNFDEHFNYDNEGSSSAAASETYRGPNAVSEPETKAMQGLLDRIKPKFQSNMHSYGPLILYPQGWQTGSPEADNPIYVALAGTDANPAIPGFDPGISSDELYVTNGETTDYADSRNGTVAFTPELGEGCEGCNFVFPDDPALVEAEFQKALPFSLSLAKSAPDPANPKSSVGIGVKPFYLDQADADPENGPLSMLDFTFTESYGDPQEVRVLAKKSLGAVTAKWQIGTGPVQSAATSEWQGGERYKAGNSNYYHVVRATVTGTSPGDDVKVWFEGGGQTSSSFTYRALSESGRKVLVLAAEDYTGASPVKPGVAAPQYLSYYADALTANGISFDVYDVDAHGRKAPDALGVLSHYKAVIWYTGDDVVTREPGWGPGNASSLAQTELFEIRDYLNEGGKVLYTGKNAGHQYTGTSGIGDQLYDPFENKQCSTLPDEATRCRPLRGSGDGVNDVIEYWFGAAIVNGGAGQNEDGDPFAVTGVSNPLAGLTWELNGPDSAQNQNNTASFLTTSGLLPANQYPQFASDVSATWARPGGPFAPHFGDYYVYSQISDVSYKRLTRTISVPAGGAQMSFWTSFDTEPAWDHVFVEARTAGGSNWTTLPDTNGHTTTATGDSCPEGWRVLHPQLDHYQTLNADGTCSPTGSSGTWNASSGSSNGWQQWNVDLTAYANSQVEISIAYVSDWSVQGLGMFIDDITVTTGEGTTSFESGLDGWAITGPPAGSPPNSNNFVRTTAAGFPEGAVVRTADTLYFGFGFEGISNQATRNAVMDRSMDYLLGT